MPTTVINSLSELNRITSNSLQISIIDFHAVWCGPCKVISPVFDRLSGTFSPRIHFLKVDVDRAKDVAAQFSIRAMPTFVVLKGSGKVDEMKGADPQGLEAMVRKWAPPVGSSGENGSGEKGLEGYGSLNSLIDTSQISCLNESSDHTIRDLIKGGGDKWLESDADEQLLLHIPTQATRIRALRFTTLPSVSAQAPKTIKLFVNRPALGFDDAESLEPAQEIVLSESQASGKEAVQLRFVRFQNVSVLSIFVADNQGGDDVTRIDKLEILGVGIDSTDMGNLKKGEHDHDH